MSSENTISGMAEAQPPKLQNGGLSSLERRKLSDGWNAVKLQTNWSLESIYSYAKPANQSPSININRTASTLQTEENASQQPTCNTSETVTENGTSSPLDFNPLLNPASQGDK